METLKTAIQERGFRYVLKGDVYGTGTARRKPPHWPLGAAP